MTYRIAVDIGGTFTDCVIADAEGNRTVAKALTTPGSLEDGVLDALAIGAEQLGTTRAALLAATDLVMHGTTQATNAILTRTGARTGLITTKGHEDAIIIGKVHSKVAGLPERDVVHSSRLRKPDPIVPRHLIRGVTERVDRYGETIVPLQEDEVIAAVDELLAQEVEAIAVSLLWSFVNDAHERRIKEIVAERAPAVFSSYSHEVAPVLGEYERTATTVVTAYVGPKVVAYLEQLERRLRDEGLGHPLLVMQASGGLTSVADAAQRPIVTLDSGPTGGILGCQHLGRLYDEENVICTDVGGTSFDVGLILHGEVPLDAEPVVAQYTLKLARCSSTRSARAAAASAGSTRAACCESGRRAPARSRGRPATAAVAPTRRSPTRISCSATSTPARSSADACASIESSRSARSPGSAPASAWSPRRWRSACSGSSTRRWPT
jgi:N-methylhydantoinase A